MHPLLMLDTPERASLHAKAIDHITRLVRADLLTLRAYGNSEQKGMADVIELFLSLMDQQRSVALAVQASMSELA